MAEATFAEKWKSLRENARKEMELAGRDPSQLQIVLVTKTVSENRILQAVEAGVLDLAESKVQEFLVKKKNLPPCVRWHMIGHLQTNKVRQIISEVACIQSLDRLDLAKEIESQAEKRGLSGVSCLVQVNASFESTKFGLAPCDVESFIESLKAYPRLALRGLMTIGPRTEDEGLIRKCFKETRMLFDFLKTRFPEYSLDTLSMGMSGDFRMAIQEGSTMIRIGTAVFGKRVLS